MPVDNTTIILLGAGFTTNNMGVWALTSGAITSILNTYSNAEIYILDYHSQPVKYTLEVQNKVVSVQLENLRFSKNIMLPNNIARLLLTALMIRFVPVRSIRRSLMLRNYWLRLIHNAKIVGSIAGGDSFSDIYGLQRLIYVALPQILVLLLRKPLILLPQTIGPFKSNMAQAVARYIMRRAATIYSRDIEGLSVAQRFLTRNHNRVQFCYDMGFILEPRIEEKRIPSFFAQLERNFPLIGLNISGLLYIGGYTQNNMFGIKTDYRRLIHNLIDYFVQKHNAHIILIPHVLGAGANRESDVTACRNIYMETEHGIQEHLQLLEDNYDQHELKALIGRCDFFLGSRMHACIAALSQSVPAVGLAYSRKFHGVYRSLGMQDLVIDIREHNESSVIALVNLIYEKRLAFKSQLENKIPIVRTSVMDLFSPTNIKTSNGCESSK